MVGRRGQGSHSDRRRRRVGEPKCDSILGAPLVLDASGTVADPGGTLADRFEGWRLTITCLYNITDQE